MDKVYWEVLSTVNISWLEIKVHDITIIQLQLRELKYQNYVSLVKEFWSYVNSRLKSPIAISEIACDG